MLKFVVIKNINVQNGMHVVVQDIFDFYIEYEHFDSENFHNFM